MLLESIGGPEAPSEWRGALPLTYRLGGGPLVVHMRVRADDRVRPIWTVTGMIRGSERPDQLVIVGNHRDAWTYGGVDPSSGTAAMMELARTLSVLTRGGWRPKRSIVFASWDAEEFTLTSSTEWGEEHAGSLQQNAVAYINVDSAASGRHFTASAVPALNRLIREVAQTVRSGGSYPDMPPSRHGRGRHAAGRLERIWSAIAWQRIGLHRVPEFSVPVADVCSVVRMASTLDLRQPQLGAHRRPGVSLSRRAGADLGIDAPRLANANTLPLDYEDYDGESKNRERGGENVELAPGSR